MKKIFLLVMICVLLGSAGYLVLKLQKNQPNQRIFSDQQIAPKKEENIMPAPVTQEATPGVVIPTEGFLSRVTLKPFGKYISPANSPVQPERFSGYHTGADAEYGDIAADVPVIAIAPGEVVVSRTAQGYGGVMVIRHDIDNKKILVLYGHLRSSSMKSVGSNIERGEQIALLGNGFTSETDGERKHLHLGILKNNRVDLRGYVQSEKELSAWYDPVEFIAHGGK